MQIRDLGLGLYGFGFRPAEIGSADFARKLRKGHGSRAHRKTAKMSQVETPSQDETEMPDCISAKLLCARKHLISCVRYVYVLCACVDTRVYIFIYTHM